MCVCARAHAHVRERTRVRASVQMLLRQDAVLPNGARPYLYIGRDTLLICKNDISTTGYAPCISSVTAFPTRNAPLPTVLVSANSFELGE